jgi:cyclopropane fatty-acyl-phospholipid synthase-like methyltransferase
MDIGSRLDLSRERRAFDDSGTPSAFIEQLRRQRELLILESVDADDVLVEFPMGRIWRDQTGCPRFVRLRHPIDGKAHAMVRRPRSDVGRDAPDAPRSSDEVPAPASLYPDEDRVGARRGLPGASILAYVTGDQLHPPMVDDADVWADGRRWEEGAVRHTLEAARFARLAPGERVLDIGCGLAGPARTLVDHYGVEVLGVSTSARMVTSAVRLNQPAARWRESIRILCHDCQQPYPVHDLDLAWSMNMLYQVPDQGAMFACAREALAPRGRLMVEDWMLTTTATAADADEMQEHFGKPGYELNVTRVTMLDRRLVEQGFAIEGLQDLGHIGRTHLAKYFRREFDRVVRPELDADFGPEGRRWADEWSVAVDATIRLYARGALTYRRVLARRD